MLALSFTVLLIVSVKVIIVARVKVMVNPKLNISVTGGQIYRTFLQKYQDGMKFLCHSI